MPGAGLVTAAAALLLCVFGVYPLANRLTGGTALEWFDHARLFWLVIGGAVFSLLLAFARVAPAAADALWRGGSRLVTRIPRRVFLGGVALFAFCAAAIFSVICFGRQPHNADEVAQLFHARILLSGRLSLPPDPNPEFFGMDNMIERGRWYSQFPVGGPAILAIGVAMHAAWLLNPVLLALSILSLYGFTRRAYDEGTARASALLLALSPFALFVSACSIQRQKPESRVSDEHISHMQLSDLLTQGPANLLVRGRLSRAQGTALAGDTPGLPASAVFAAGRLQASPRHAEWVKLAWEPGSSDSLMAWIVYPATSNAKTPVVVVIHEIFGLSTWVRNVADQVAADGFIAIAPDLISRVRGGPSTMELSGDSARKLIGNVGAAERNRGSAAVANYAMALPSAAPHYAVIGYCWGGSTTWGAAVANGRGFSGKFPMSACSHL